ncbi:hypothetical protein KMW28_27060 [Flammeovirga yaeyamensis]|uniref:Uncharacterized protein n=1 Tax=Flammeovirga yaeyamensis TaxID=367791 RepID=A0AAX1NAH4_9BACT|nr:hypothetical protein [Flammeovirga yaeyamensis]MBB3700061.1 folate-binding Fe-S cluster repair protein YgfZ [Flammeovirga yaeyamensis]NMF37503.1 hypothetical protein [Flammeovirga yaeyamensis]QWG04560.1 hypothetical protein KMW28_27060 [Flammeovirga yaeyamensis]
MENQIFKYRTDRQHKDAILDFLSRYSIEHKVLFEGADDFSLEVYSQESREALSSKMSKMKWPFLELVRACFDTDREYILHLKRVIDIKDGKIKEMKVKYADFGVYKSAHAHVDTLKEQVKALKVELNEAKNGKISSKELDALKDREFDLKCQVKELTMQVNDIQEKLEAEVKKNDSLLQVIMKSSDRKRTAQPRQRKPISR